MTKCNRIPIAILLMGLAMTTAFAEGAREIEADAAAGFNPPGELPIAVEPVTISTFVSTRPNVTSYEYEDNVFTRWLTDRTNVHFDWVVVPRGDLRTRRNLMMASGDYPEMMLRPLFSYAEQLAYGRQGALMDLTVMIEEYGVNYQRMLEEYPQIESQVRLDGAVYSFPLINDNLSGRLRGRAWIYQPWLDALGLDMPNTTEEFRDVLIAFRDQDPNGTGQQDTIPFAGAIEGFNVVPTTWFMNAFIYADQAKLYYYLEPATSTIAAAFVADEWREGLRYMRDLYVGGLIAPETFTQSEDQLRALGENDSVQILGSFTSSWPGSGAVLGGESGRWLEYTAIPPLEGPDGHRSTWYTPIEAGSAGGVITDKAQHPEIAFMLMDYMYDLEVTLRKAEGRPGIEWRWAKEGELSAAGTPAVWARITQEGAKEPNVSWNQMGPQYKNAEYNNYGQVASPTDVNTILYRESVAKYEPYAPVDHVIPPLIFTDDEAPIHSELAALIDAYVTESVARFVVGDLNIERDWNTYLDELRRLGMDEYTELLQRAYDRQYQ